MKVLYVVSRPLEINTSASIRNKATIEGLIELGYEIDLITSEFDSNHFNFDGSIINEKINIRYLKLNGIQTAARIGRKLRALRFLKGMIYKLTTRVEIYDNLKGIGKYASKLGVSDEDYEFIISSSDPKSSHLLVCKLFEKGVIKDTPWIQIWGDPFLSDITRSNKGWLFNYKVRQQENRLLNYATKVIYVSKLTLNEQQKLYPQFSKKMDYEPIPYVRKESYQLFNKSKNPITFLYCGDYVSSIRNLKPLYEAIKNTEHKLVICGNSDLNLVSTDRIKIYPRVTFEKTKEYERECDVLIHLSNIKGTQIPGKIYQYSGTNKIILFILDGDISSIRNTFENYERYVFSDNNSKNIEEAIQQIKNGIFDRTQFIVEQFNPKIIAGNIIKLNKGLAPKDTCN